MMTYLYTILDGRTVRLPLNLDARPVCRGADWLHVEPWCEPPSRVCAHPRCKQCKSKDCQMKKRYDTRRVVMTCNKCGFKKQQVQRGVCHRCSEGIMTHETGKVKILIKDKAK